MLGKTNVITSVVGGVLTVTGTTGDTVTVSKDGKTQVKQIDTDGSAIFKGLESGVWVVTMSNSIGQIATQNIIITADYEVTIAFFSATISITYPANSTCVITDSSGATVASDTNVDTNAKTWTVTVGSTGTYTITATETGGSKTKSTTATITTEGQTESVVLRYELLLYDAGDQCTDITGGWDMYKYDGGVASNNGFHDDHFTIQPNYPTRVSFATKQKIDLTEIKTLRLLARVYQEKDITASYKGGYFGVGSVQHPIADVWGETTSSNWTARVALKKAADYTEFSLDVSKLSGSYYVNVCGISANSVQVFVDAKSVIGEPV